MSLESPDNEKNFPGLYKQGSLMEPATEEDGGGGAGGKKVRDSSRKRDGKKDKKEKGYTMFEEEESEEEIILPDDVKSPTKAKKNKPGFKFPVKKDIFPRMKEKEEKKDKELKKEEKEKKKEEKEGKKVKVKDKEKKKSKHALMELNAPPPPASTCENPIFGIPLALAVERNKSHDGIHLPAIVRECIDYVEECGLMCEGIYRISGVKSKVQQLKDSYNKGVPVDLVEHEPNIVASLLKQFLRELPEPVLTTALMPKFEEASTIKNEKKKVDMFIRLIEDLPACNRLLLSWMIVHMTHIIELQKENKMSLQNVSIVLSPTMQISHRVLNALFTLAHQIFKDTYLKKYVPPLKPATSRWSLELPDNTGALEEELAKQESLLNQLHGRLNAGHADPHTEDQLWEVQRVVTQLKRKIKFAKKAQGTAERRRKDLEVKRSSQLSDTEELHLELRQAPAPPPPSTTTTTAGSTTITTTAVVAEPPKEAEAQKDTSPAKTTAAETKTQKTAATAKKTEQKPAKTEKTEKPQAAPASQQEEDAGKGRTEESPKPKEVEKVKETKSETKRKSLEAKEEEPLPEEDESVRKPQDQSEECKPEDKEAPAPVEPQQQAPAVPPVASATEPTHDETQDAAEVKAITEPSAEEEEAAAKPQQPPAQSEPAPAETDVAKKPEEEAPGEQRASPHTAWKPAAEGKVVMEEEGGGEKDEGREEVVTLTDSMKGAGEVGEEVVMGVDSVTIKVNPPALPMTDKPAEIPPKMVPTIVEDKPRGPVQVHPQLYLLLEPLQPIKAQPLKPRRERPEKTEESHRRSAKLRELEEELLGGGSLQDQRERPGEADTAGDEKADTGEDYDYDYDPADDEELQLLVEEEFSMRLEEEELLAIGDELRKKIETEESEIERLQQEIQELQYLRHDSDLEEMSSGSDSSYESEDEDDMNEMLTTLIQENLQLERENAEMCQKIHEERMICLSVKLQIRLLQQKQLESSQSSLLGDA